MKKIFFLLVLAVAAFAAQAVEITLFEGTNTSRYAPIYAYNNDIVGHRTQTILPASELAAIEGATINSMKFYLSSASTMTSGKLALSVGTTEMNSFYNTFIEDGLTQVGEYTAESGATEILVEFDEPWVYNGGNMVIEFKVVEKGNYTYLNFYGQSNNGANAIYGDMTQYTEGFYPKTTFDVVPVGDKANVSATALDFGQLYPDQEAEGQTFTIKNIGLNAFTPVFSAVAAPFSVTPAPAEIASGESMTFTVNFAPTELGNYNQTLGIDCGTAGQFEIALTGAVVERPAEVVIAEGTATSSTLPVEVGAYNYSAAGNQAQMIYNGDLLTDLVGKKINGIKFHASAPLQSFNGGQIQLSLKVVEQSAFESYTPITDLTVVATGAPVIGESELVFVFDEPFTYEGGNLVVETMTTQAGDYSFRDKFLGVATTEYVSYGHFNDLGWETHTYKFLPMATFGYVKEDTPQPAYELGDVDHSEGVDIDDVTILINKVLGNAPANYFPEQANCNGDAEGMVDIDDVTALIKRVLTGAW